MSTKPNGKSIISSSDGNGESKTGSNPVQSTVVKANGKTHVSSDDNRELMLFNEVSLGPQETNLRFRLVHFWEARNPLQKTLIGDRYSRLCPTRKNQKIHATYETRRSGLYTLTSFYGSRNKEVFRVAAHSVTISFSHTSELVPLENIPWTSRRTVSGSIPMKTSKLAVI
ncbi:hypothetical protein HID58_012280 [Brassica napus]|uniref:Uncharacterized protein n=1 Tax=Brassica napus TaxID=3708 RepID=A0ABQ8E130_BRANA|nr:hypothetical protein HID58_012280 [Brassica napus]